MKKTSLAGKRILFYIFASIIFLGFFELYIRYLFWQDMDFGGFFSSVLYSVMSPEPDKIIRINLYNNSLVLIDDGQLFMRDKISAAGHPKISPTPTGNFWISTKSKRLISNLSGLVMPYSLRFNGPYFLHGLPTYRDGRVYYSTYSAGCIRLGPGLDQIVYNWADIGTKVQIYNTWLVKSADDPRVFYLTQEGRREPIADPEEFLSRGFKWKDVKEIPLVELAALPIASTTTSAALD